MAGFSFVLLCFSVVSYKICTICLIVSDLGIKAMFVCNIWVSLPVSKDVKSGCSGGEGQGEVYCEAIWGSSNREWSGWLIRR